MKILKLILKCWSCGVVKEIEVDEQAYIDWTNGKYAINAFPELDEDAREFIISKTCPKCFDKHFGPKEDYRGKEH